jgi:hypothetical protein
LKRRMLHAHLLNTSCLPIHQQLCPNFKSTNKPQFIFRHLNVWSKLSYQIDIWKTTVPQSVKWKHLTLILVKIVTKQVIFHGISILYKNQNIIYNDKSNICFNSCIFRYSLKEKHTHTHKLHPSTTWICAALSAILCKLHSSCCSQKQRHVRVCVECRLPLSTVTKLECLHILIKLYNIKFHDNQFGSFSVVICGQTNIGRLC